MGSCYTPALMVVQAKALCRHTLHKPLLVSLSGHTVHHYSRGEGVCRLASSDHHNLSVVAHILPYHQAVGHNPLGPEVHSRLFLAVVHRTDRILPGHRSLHGLGSLHLLCCLLSLQRAADL